MIRRAAAVAVSLLVATDAGPVTNVLLSPAETMEAVHLESLAATPSDNSLSSNPLRRYEAGEQLLEHVDAAGFFTDQAVPIRGRPNLPSGESELVPEFIHAPPDTSSFPFVLRARDAEIGEVPSYAREFRRLIDEQSLLLRHGAALIRGAPVRTAQDLSVFIEHLGWVPRKLGGGGTARSDVAPNVRTASDEPATHNIEPHMDMAHNPTFPHRIAFMMAEGAPPGHGGETVLVDMRNVTQALRAAGVVDEFQAHGGQVLYRKVLWSADQVNHSFTWQRRYFTNDPSHVDTQLSLLEGVHWRWSNGTLEYENTMPTMHTHPQTGEELWFNGAHTNNRDYFDLAPHIDTSQGSPFDTAFGDGEAVSSATLAKIRRAIWENSVALNLQAGDVVVVDNMLVAHGRLSWDPEVSRRMFLCHFD